VFKSKHTISRSVCRNFNPFEGTMFRRRGPADSTALKKKTCRPMRHFYYFPPQFLKFCLNLVLSRKQGGHALRGNGISWYSRKEPRARSTEYALRWPRDTHHCPHERAKCKLYTQILCTNLLTVDSELSGEKCWTKPAGRKLFLGDISVSWLMFVSPLTGVWASKELTAQDVIMEVFRTSASGQWNVKVVILSYSLFAKVATASD